LFIHLFFLLAILALSAKMMHPSRQAFVEDHPMEEVSQPNRSFSGGFRLCSKQYSSARLD
jgi:hypothetical protein